MWNSIQMLILDLLSYHNIQQNFGMFQVHEKQFWLSISDQRSTGEQVIKYTIYIVLRITKVKQILRRIFFGQS